MATVAIEKTLEGDDRDTVRVLADRAIGDGTFVDDEGANGFAFSQLTGVLVYLDEYDTELALIDRALERARRTGSFSEFATSSYVRIWPQYQMGLVADAAADGQRAVDAVRQGWQLWPTAARSHLGLALLELGDVAGAEAAVDLAESDWRATMESFIFLYARGTVRLHQGRVAEAVADLAAALAAAVSYGIQNPAVAPLRSALALALAATGEHARARDLAEEELALAHQWGTPRTIGVALQAIGQIEDDATRIEEAVTMLEPLPSRLALLHALVSQGAQHARSDRPADARRSFTRAHAEATRFGMTALAERALTGLVAAGGRPRRSAVGPAALTPAERRVAQMVAGGLRNREVAEALFLTEKAVERHLSAVYRKLGVRSRTQLPAALRPPADGDDE